MILQPADVVMCRGSGAVSAAIRLGTQEPRELQSIVNHVGILSRGGRVSQACIVEALPQGVVERRLQEYRRPGADSCVIYRLQTLTPAQRDIMAALARAYVGRGYGWLRILADAGDWILGSKWFFRSMIRPQRQMVCSSVVARAYDVVNYKFRALSPDDITPDDIWDDITNNVPPWVPVGCL